MFSRVAMGLIVYRDIEKTSSCLPGLIPFWVAFVTIVILFMHIFVLLQNTISV